MTPSPLERCQSIRRYHRNSQLRTPIRSLLGPTLSTYFGPLVAACFTYRQAVITAHTPPHQPTLVCAGPTVPASQALDPRRRGQWSPRRPSSVTLSGPKHFDTLAGRGSSLKSTSSIAFTAALMLAGTSSASRGPDDGVAGRISRIPLGTR